MVDRSADSVEHVVAGLVGSAPYAGGAFVVGNRDRPAFGERGHDEQEFQLGKRADRFGAAAQRVGRETAPGHGVDSALVGDDRQGPRRRPFGGYHDGGDADLRLSVEIGGAVQQLGGTELLPDQPHERKFHIT